MSTPVTWGEVENCLKKSDPELLVFAVEEVLKRVEKSGDLFASVLKLKQKLPALQALAGTSSKTASPSPRRTTPGRTKRKTLVEAGKGGSSPKPKAKAQ